jgi:hypothetical protein
MNDLIEMQVLQIEALQKEVQKKENCLQEAKRLLCEAVELIENFNLNNSQL